MVQVGARMRPTPNAEGGFDAAKEGEGGCGCPFGGSLGDIREEVLIRRLE